MAARATGAAAIAVESKFSQLIRSGELKSIDALAYGTLKGIPGDEHCFSYRLAAHHAYGSHQALAISKTHNPDHYNIKHLLVNKPSPLWLSVFCAKLHGGNKKVIRTHMMRRIRTAIKEALRKYDYDLSGKRISDGKGDDLVGTMIISAKDKALTAKMDILQDQADMAVAALIRKFKLEREARHYSSNHNFSKQARGTPSEVKRVQMKYKVTRKESGTTVTFPKRKKEKNKVFGGTVDRK